VSIEECWEILLLAANGYQNGADKLMRGLYERALTIHYLIKFPEKAERFKNFGAIQEHRTLSPALAICSEDELNARIHPHTVAEIREHYQEHKAQFQITECRKCNTSRLAGSWDVDVTTMAKAVGEGFPQLMLLAYTLPTLQLHTTLASAWSRMTPKDDGYIFSYDIRPELVDASIFHALGLIVMVHLATAQFFEQPLQQVKKLESALVEYGKKYAATVATPSPAEGAPPTSDSTD
jgi:hypothetical protein